MAKKASKSVVDVTRGNGDVVDKMPTDLARVAGKGLGAMEAFLDQRTDEDVSEDVFRRSLAYAETGCKAVSYGLTAIGHALRAEALALAHARMPETT